jgi:hypothetical protein
MGRIVFLGGGGQRSTKRSEVARSGVWVLEISGSAPKHVPGPSRTGRRPSESRSSNSPTDVLPRGAAERRTLAFAGLLCGHPHHCGARGEPRSRALSAFEGAQLVPHGARVRAAARHGVCGQSLGLPGSGPCCGPGRLSRQLFAWGDYLLPLPLLRQTTSSTSST